MNTQLASLVCATTLAMAGLPVSGYAQWQVLGPRDIPQSAGLPGAGKLQAFAVDFANPQVMYAGGGIGPGNSGPAGEAGIFKTTDGGNTWTNINNGLTDPMVVVLWLDQSNPDILLAGTWFGGIFRSTDAGAHWTLVRSGTTTALVQAGQTVYAGTASGVAASTDAGATWSLIKSTSASALALAANGGALYAGLGNGDVLYQASPASTWQRILSQPGRNVWSIAVDPASPQTIYVVEWSNYTPSLFATSDSGGTWTLLSPPGYNGATQVVAVDSSGAVYAGLDGSLYLSNDHGTNWTAIPEAGVDMRSILLWPDEANKFVIGSDQGLYMTTNSGSSWVDLNGHIASSLLTGLAVSDSTVLTAVQDYSPLASFDGGASWEQFWGAAPPIGEDGVARFNPGNPNYVYVFTTSGFQYSSDGGHNFSPAPELPGSEFTFAGGHNLIGVDPGGPSNVYVIAQSGIFKSMNWGVAWTKQPWPLTNASLVVVSPDDSQTIFVGTKSSGLHFTHDGGASWTHSNPGITSPLYALDIDPANPAYVLLGMSAAPGSGGGVLLSTNGGTNFVADNAGLAPLSASFGSYVCAIKFHPGSTNGVAAVATLNGIYLSTAPGTPWVDISGDAVPRQFSDLEWAGTNLYTATYGEGVLGLPLPLSVASQAVSPPSELTSVGNRGGPFSPTSQQYSVSNDGGGMLKWTASVDKDWVTVTPGSGTNSGTVTVSINDNAKSLYGSPAGITYDAIVWFGSNGGNASRRVALTVYDNGGVVLVPVGIQRDSGLSPDAVRVLWNPDATRSYQLEWASSVDALVWFGLGWPFLGSRSNSVPDFMQGSPQRFYRVAELSQPVIPDPEGNLIGDTNRTFMDIVATTLRLEGTNFTLDVQMAAPFPTAAEMAGGKRFDVIWFIDIDRNRSTGQSPLGNDYNIQLFLDETGWHHYWFKVDSVSQADGIVNLDSAFTIGVLGDRATLTFPRTYLPSHSFEVWATCFTGNAPSWTPFTQNPNTARAVFNF
ncbi:MAG: BACON domain-containing protein [Limisphaerales bacterium]